MTDRPLIWNFPPHQTNIRVLENKFTVSDSFSFTSSSKLNHVTFLNSLASAETKVIFTTDIKQLLRTTTFLEYLSLPRNECNSERLIFSQLDYGSYIYIYIYICKNAIAFLVGEVALLLADNIKSSHHIMTTETTTRRFTRVSVATRRQY